MRPAPSASCFSTLSRRTRTFAIGQRCDQRAAHIPGLLHQLIASATRAKPREFRVQTPDAATWQQKVETDSVQPMLRLASRIFALQAECWIGRFARRDFMGERGVHFGARDGERAVLAPTRPRAGCRDPIRSAAMRSPPAAARARRSRAAMRIEATCGKIVGASRWIDRRGRIGRAGDEHGCEHGRRDCAGAPIAVPSATIRGRRIARSDRDRGRCRLAQPYLRNPVASPADARRDPCRSILPRMRLPITPECEMNRRVVALRRCKRMPH